MNILHLLLLLGGIIVVLLTLAVINEIRVYKVRKKLGLIITFLLLVFVSNAQLRMPDPSGLYSSPFTYENDIQYKRTIQAGWINTASFITVCFIAHYGTQKQYNISKIAAVGVLSISAVYCLNTNKFHFKQRKRR